MEIVITNMQKGLKNIKHAKTCKTSKNLSKYNYKRTIFPFVNLTQ
jgi:hypothetical protein